MTKLKSRDVKLFSSGHRVEILDSVGGILKYAKYDFCPRILNILSKFTSFFHFLQNNL